MATTRPMSGHNDLGLDVTLRFRVEEELKQKFAALARRKRKTVSQLMREKLWEIVDQDEKTGGQADLPLQVVEGGRQ